MREKRINFISNYMCWFRTINATKLFLVFFPVTDKFYVMIDQHSTMAQFCLWIHSVVDSYTSLGCVGAGGGGSGGDGTHLITRIRKFLVVWTSFSAKMLKQLKLLKSSTSSASEFAVWL